MGARPAVGRADLPTPSGRGPAHALPVAPVGLPPWLHWSLAGVLAVLLGVGLAGLPLAMAGQFKPAFVLIGSVAIGGLVLWHWPRPAPGSPSGTGVAAAFTFVFVVGLTAFNVAHSSQHLLTDRDPGVYLTTGQWLASHGHLLFAGAQGPFQGVHGVTVGGQGYVPTGATADSSLYPQFLHLLPVYLAVARWLGGTGLMLAVNPLLGGVALLAVFAFASQLLRPWLATAVVVALGLNLVEVHFARDVFTEIADQAFLFGALWMAWGASGRQSTRRVALAGLLTGAACMTRIDAYLFCLPFVAWLGHRRLRGLASASREEREAVPAGSAGDDGSRRELVVGSLALAVPAVLGLADAYFFSRPYLRGLQGGLVETLGLLAVLVVVLVFLSRRRSRGGGPLWSPSTRQLRLIGSGVLVAGLLAGSYVWFLRPLGAHPVEHRSSAPEMFVEHLQRVGGLPVQAGRTYAEHSAHWLALYLGVGGLAVGTVGLVLMVREGIARRQAQLLLFGGLFLIPTVLYLWRPSITPDQIFAMRRFLPVTIPALIVGAGWLADRLLAAQDGASLMGLARSLGGLAVPPSLRSPSLSVPRTQGTQRTRRLQRPPVAQGSVGAFSAVAALGVSGGLAVLVAMIAYPLWVFIPLSSSADQVGVRAATEQLCSYLGPNGAALIVRGIGLDVEIPQDIEAFCNVPVAIASSQVVASTANQLAAQWKRSGRVLSVLSSGPSALGGVRVEAPLRVVADYDYQVLKETLNTRPSGTTDVPGIEVWAARPQAQP